MLRLCLCLSLGGVLAFAQAPAGSKKAPLPFTCDVFSPKASAASLAQRFGAKNVTTGMVRVPEFDDEEGTILFASDPEDRAEIYWLDRAAKRGPERVFVGSYRKEKAGEAPRSRWVSARGIKLGMPVSELERMNGRPLKLFFSDTDLANVVMSWNGGRLNEGERRDKCGLGIIYLEYDITGSRRTGSTAWEKVFDDSGTELWSDHEAVQEVKPYVIGMVIENDDPRP